MVVMALMVAWLAQSPAQADDKNDKTSFDWATTLNTGNLPPVHGASGNTCSGCHTNPAQKPALDAALLDPSFVANHGQPAGGDQAVDPNCPKGNCHTSPYAMKPSAEPNWNGAPPCNTNCHSSTGGRLAFTAPILPGDKEKDEAALLAWIQQQQPTDNPPPAPDKPKPVRHHRRATTVAARAQLDETATDHGSGQHFDGTQPTQPTQPPTDTPPTPTADNDPKPNDPQPQTPPTTDAPSAPSTPSRYSTAQIAVPTPTAGQTKSSGYDFLTGSVGGGTFALIGLSLGAFGGPIGVGIGAAIGAIFGALLGLFS